MWAFLIEFSISIKYIIETHTLETFHGEIGKRVDWSEK